MSFFGNKKLIIVLVGLVILITIIGFTSRDRQNLTGPEKFLKDTISVVQGFFYRPALAVSDFVQGIGDAYNVYEENRALKASLDQYAQLSADVKLKEMQIKELQAALQAKKSLHDYQVRYGEVASRNTDQWSDTITIDLGSKNGIKKDMAVLNPTGLGLIGRVQTVSNFSSTVELLSSPKSNSHISAMIVTKQIVNGVPTNKLVNGVVEAYDPKERLLIMRKIPLDQKFSVKDPVVTSGLAGVIPKNLLIGQVVKVESGDYGLTQTAYIQPSADLSQISSVLVVERSFVTTPTGELVPSSQVDEAGNVNTPATADVGQSTSQSAAQQQNQAQTSSNQAQSTSGALTSNPGGGQ